MEDINYYIQEKLRLSNSKVIKEYNIIEKYCIVIIYDIDAFDIFKKYFKDNYILSPKYGDAYILEADELIPYYNKYDIDIFRIPNRYKDKSLEEFKKEFKQNKIKPGELKEFNFEKYLKDNL